MPHLYPQTLISQPCHSGHPALQGEALGRCPFMATHAHSGKQGPICGPQRVLKKISLVNSSHKAPWHTRVRLVLVLPQDFIPVSAGRHAGQRVCLWDCVTGLLVCLVYGKVKARALTAGRLIE
jgi:hypothetical protein